MRAIKWLAVVSLWLVMAGCASSRPPTQLQEADQLHGEAIEHFTESCWAVAVKCAANFKAGRRDPILSVGKPRIIVLKSRDRLAAITGLSACVNGQELHGACDFDRGVIYVVGLSRDVLHHELGHWFLGPDEAQADAFMESVLATENEARGLKRVLTGNER